MLGCSVIPINYYLLLGLYGLIGFSIPAIAFGSIYLNEIGNTNYRSKSNMIIFITWGIGELIFIGIGYKW